jgi:hypothetical protein
VTTPILQDETSSVIANAIMADPNMWYVLKIGTCFGLLVGFVLSGAVTSLYIYHWAGKIYERGIFDAQNGWRGVNIKRSEQDW